MSNGLDQRFVNGTESSHRLSNESDESLMASYLDGASECLEVLVKRYERELYSFLRRMVVDAGLAEDVFQNTFMQVHLKRHLFDVGRPFRPWLYTIATHQAIDALRRHQRYHRVRLSQAIDGAGDGDRGWDDRPDSDLLDPSVQAEQRERQRLVRKTVDSLSDHLRSVIVLGYYQGLKYKDIADALHIPVGTVKSRLHAAIHRLAEEWERLGFTSDE